MSRLLYRLINPVVAGVLRSPLHPLLSGNTLLLHYRGRRSGRAYHTPVSYHEHDGEINCFAGREHHWWRNLQQAESVSLRLRGHWLDAVPRVTADAPELLIPRLRDFLRAVPRDAAHSGVRLDRSGEPLAADLAAAAPALVHVALRPVEQSPQVAASEGAGS